MQLFDIRPLVIWLFLALLIGIFSGALASSRNRSFIGWFLIGVILGPFGFLVAAFPKLDIKQKLTKCPPQCLSCAYRISEDAITCPSCGSQAPLSGEKVLSLLDGELLYIKRTIENRQTYSHSGSVGFYDSETLLLLGLVFIAFEAIFRFNSWPSTVTPDTINAIHGIATAVMILSCFVLYTFMWYRKLRSYDYDKSYFSNMTPLTTTCFLYSNRLHEKYTKQLALVNFSEKIKIIKDIDDLIKTLKTERGENQWTERWITFWWTCFLKRRPIFISTLMFSIAITIGVALVVSPLAAFVFVFLGFLSLFYQFSLLEQQCGWECARCGELEHLRNDISETE